MLKGAGASGVIVGHSVRRQHHDETNATVAAKAKAARRAGLLAIICVGERKSQRLDGKALSRTASHAGLGNFRTCLGRPVPDMLGDA
jgi:triosephosphate isomerase